MTEATNIISGTRELIQDLLAPDLRAIKMQLDQLQKQQTALTEEVRTGFQNMERRLDTYQDVQALKLQMARLQDKDKPAA